LSIVPPKWAINKLICYLFFYFFYVLQSSHVVELHVSAVCFHKHICLWIKTICNLFLYAFLPLQSTHADTLGFQELRLPAVSQVLRPQVLPEQALRVCLLQGRTKQLYSKETLSKRCNVIKKMICPVHRVHW
jgi:hypothetical protein